MYRGMISILRTIMILGIGGLSPDSYRAIKASGTNWLIFGPNACLPAGRLSYSEGVPSEQTKHTCPDPSGTTQDFLIFFIGYKRKHIRTTVSGNDQ